MGNTNNYQFAFFSTENLLGFESFLYIFASKLTNQLDAIGMIDGKNNELSASKAMLREKIIVVALDAFSKNGIKSITMDEIAALLGISKRTLYEVFNDKEELLIAGLEYQQKEMIKFSNKVLEQSSNVLEITLKFYEKSLEIYHSTNAKFFEDMHKYPKVQAKLKENRERDSRKTVEFLQKGVEQGLFRNDINFEVMQILLKEQVHVLMNTDLCKAFSFIDVYESIMFVFMRGISTLKGQEILDKFISEYKSRRKNIE